MHTTQTSDGSTTIRDHVSRHPLLAFTLLTLLISWVAYALSERLSLGVVDGFGILFSAGPAVAATLVSAILAPEPSGVPAGKRWPLFIAVSVAAMAIMAARRLWISDSWIAYTGVAGTSAPYPSQLALIMDVVAAGVVGYCFSSVHSARRGPQALWRSLDTRRHPVSWFWWVVAIGLYPATVALGNALSSGLGAPVPAAVARGPWHLLALDVLLTFGLLIFHGGGLEEPGWRGLALPTLQDRFGPVRSSLVLALIWALWHWPFFWTAGLAGGLVALAFYLVVEIVPAALILTAIYNGTRGSLPVVILLHTAINVTAVYLPVSMLATGLWAMLGLITAVWMWRSRQAVVARGEVGPRERQPVDDLPGAAPGAAAG